MRATMLAMASARCGPLKPSRSRSPSRPSSSIAHRPTCSTPAERGRISSSVPTSTVCRSAPPPDGAPLSNCATKALGMPLNFCRTGQRHQIALAVEQLPDAGAQNRPVMAFEREVAAEVEQRALPDLLACALRAHQAMRIIDLAARAGAGSGAPDEHGAQHRDGRKSLEPQCKNIMALHRRPENLNPAISKACQTSRPQYRPNHLYKR